MIATPHRPIAKDPAPQDGIASGELMVCVTGETLCVVSEKPIAVHGSLSQEEAMRAFGDDGSRYDVFA